MVIGELDGIATQEVLSGQVAHSPGLQLGALVERGGALLVHHDDEEVRALAQAASRLELRHRGSVDACSTRCGKSGHRDSGNAGILEKAATAEAVRGFGVLGHGVSCPSCH